MSYAIVRRLPEKGIIEVIFDGDEKTRVAIPVPKAVEGTAAFDEEILKRREDTLTLHGPDWFNAPGDPNKFKRMMKVHDRRRVGPGSTPTPGPGGAVP